MNVFVYKADLYCEDCGNKIAADLTAHGICSEDSDTFPQGPYSNGGGEADSPQHCGRCFVFLENPLTTDGYDYIKGFPLNTVPETWKEFYNV